VQSAYSKGSTQHRPSTSSDAAWGNIRHGKGLRLDAHWSVVAGALAACGAGATVLDIGSNRGDLLRRVSQFAPGLKLVGVEPDTSLRDTYPLPANAEVLWDRFERSNLEGISFDFIYCSHTLEHADSAREMLEKAHSLGRPGTMLFVEVPDIGAIRDTDVVEEFFIDKHSFHFAASSLDAMLEATGWTVSARPTDGSFNLSRLCIWTDQMSPVKTSTSADLIDDLAAYAGRLEANRQLLARAGRWLSDLEARQRVCIWGAGRVFDALVRYGNYQPQRVLLVDDYLSRHLTDIHGYPLRNSAAIPAFAPQVAMLLTRSSTNAVGVALRGMGVRNTVSFSELLSIVAADAERP
jgi:hypothetical protein